MVILGIMFVESEVVSPTSLVCDLVEKLQVHVPAPTLQAAKMVIESHGIHL